MRFLHSCLATASIAASLLFVSGCATHVDESHQPVENNSPAADEGGHSDFESAAKHPASAKTLYTMARILETQGKESQAEFILRKIIRQHPDYAPAYCDLSETLLRQRRAEEAERILRTGLNVAPRDAILMNDLGMCKLLGGEYQLALKHFTAAAGVAPDDARFRSNMAVALGMMGRDDEALALYSQILPADEAHYNLGVLCDARHDSARALIEYRTAQSLKAAAALKEAAAQSTNTQKISLQEHQPEMGIQPTTRPTG